MATIAEGLNSIKSALTGAKIATTIPWDPECTQFPTRKELPPIDGAPKEAAWCWGKDDNLGRLNLQTPSRVLAASKEIKTGEVVCLDLPLGTPKYPCFQREQFEHKIKQLEENGTGFDDCYTLNTQSSTQWDGFRHFAHFPSRTFYNGITAKDIVGPTANMKGGMHHWAEHRIVGRGVLLDYWSYAKKKGIVYDPYTSYGIGYDELYACGKDQGVDIRPEAQGGDIKVGDIMFIRSGFVETYLSLPEEKRKAAGARTMEEQCWIGIEQEEKILDWLHDCYFSAIAGDMPGFEKFPTLQPYHLHEYILSLWGMPLGELLNLEALASKCREYGRWSFFVTSAPGNVPGGVGSHVNGTAIF